MLLYMHILYQKLMWGGCETIILNSDSILHVFCVFARMSVALFILIIEGWVMMQYLEQQ